MGFQLKNNYYYYRIIQIINNKKQTDFKLYNVNEESIIKLTRIMAGTVTVYIYYEKDNKRIDMTDKLGRYNKVDSYRIITNTNLQFYTKTASWHERSLFINKVILYKDTIKDIFKHETSKKNMYIVKRWGSDGEYSYSYYGLKKIELIGFKKTYVIEDKVSKELNEFQSKESKTIGDEYEKFIGQKYESLGQNVIYHGLNKGKKDNGIDLIIDKEASITFVQCKNWKSMGHYKLNQKDLRAFIGDCYMYMFNNNIDKKHNFHFIVSDQELLTKSAEIYVKENRKLKYKVIPFEE